MNSEKSILRTAAVAAGLVGAVVSLALMLRACNQNPSRVVLALIGIWVISPFVVLLLADVVSKRWPLFGRVTVHGLALVVSFGATAIYSLDALMHLSPRKGFVFAAVPAASLVLIALILLVAACLGRKESLRPRAR